MKKINDSHSDRIRQLCLRLKPLLGSQMEQVFAAYQAEDAPGKEQIEIYLENLYARQFPSQLDQPESVLIPPTAEQARGEYPIGQVLYAGKELCPFGLREDEWIQHVAILGRSGAGKTNAGFVLLKSLQDKGKPFLLFDWKRNYRDLLALPQFQNVEVYTIGRDIAPFRFNPLIPPPGTSPKTWLKKLNEVIAHAYCLGNGVLYLLQQAVDKVYQQAGVYTGKVAQWPTYRDVLVTAREMDLRGRESGWLSSTLRALSSLCFGDMDKLLNSKNNQNLGQILEKSVILELDALTQSDKVFFTQALLLWIHHLRMTEPRREKLKHIIIIEEAHHVLSDERHSLVGGQSVMEIIFREIREFGEALVLLDQHPSKISLPALGNTYCTICMNLKHRSDINAVAQCLLLDQEKELLGSLEIGQAIVKLQGRIAKPFHIQIPEFPLVKGKITDEQIRNRKPGVGSDLMAIPSVEDSQEQIISGQIAQVPQLIRALLADINSFPESGIAQRYQRLGLSVRQGQKLKNQAHTQGFIEEELATYHQGRVRFLKITSQGAIVLTQNPHTE